MDPLRLIGGAVSAVRSLAGATTNGVQDAGFRALLEEARSGTASSGLAVQVGQGVGVSLTDAQLGRLSRAADIAEVQGIESGVFLVDGKALKVDVSTRTVTGVIDPSQTSVHADADGIIVVGGGVRGDAAGTSETNVNLDANLGAILGVPKGAIENRDLAGVLGGARGSGE